MTIHYSKSTGGFYDSDIHGDAIPEDAKEIPQERHTELMNAQAAGRVIVAGDDGRPTLADRPEPTEAEAALAQIVALEQTITPRRLREAVLGTDKGWLKGVEAQIAALRAKL